MLTRYYGIWDLAGESSADFNPNDIPSVEDKVVDVDHVYTSDHGVSVSDEFDPETGIHYYEYYWKHVDSGQTLDYIRWMTWNEGAISELYVWNGTGWDDEGALGFPQQLESVISPSASEAMLGAYQVRRKKSVEGLEGPEVEEDILLGTLDILALMLKNVRADKPRFQPDSDESTTTLRADAYALPASSGWFPTEDVDWKLELDLRHSNGLDSLHEDGFFGALEVEYDDGFINDIAEVWDGIRERTGVDDELAEGQFIGKFNAIAVRDGEPGNIWSGFTSCDGCCYRCRCQTNQINGRVHESLHLGSGFPPLTYDSFAHDQAAASLGFGWSSVGSAKLIVDGTKLVYRAEGGAFLRWTWTGSAYEPFFPDHPSTVVKAEQTSSSPDTFQLTFPDQSTREFDDAGRLTRDADRNGNELLYEYNGSGYLESVSDGRGRTQFFLYGSRTDGQPEQILLNDDDPMTARKVSFSYDSPSDRLETVTNAAGEVLRFTYFESGLLKEIIQVKESTDEVVMVAYTYDPQGRVATKTLFGESRINYAYWISFDI